MIGNRCIILNPNSLIEQVEGDYRTKIGKAKADPF